MMEKQGIICPVLSIRCEYKSMSRFGETVQVLTSLKEYNGIKMALEYTVIDKETAQVRCVGESRHCFPEPGRKPRIP